MERYEFRGMDANGKMRYGQLSQDKPDSTVYYKEYSQRICWDYSNIPVSNKTLSQSTGKYDKNDKKLFDGDTIKLTNCYHKEFNGEELVVKYNDEYNTFIIATLDELKQIEEKKGNHFKYAFQVLCPVCDCEVKLYFLSQLDSYEFEIIGNIYENNKEDN